MKNWYTCLNDTLVKSGIARVNPDFDPGAVFDDSHATPERKHLAVLVDYPELMGEWDETGVEASMAKTSQRMRMRGVGARGSQRQAAVPAQSGHRFSSTIAHFADGSHSASYNVFSGGSLDPNWYKDAPRSTARVPDGHGGLTTQVALGFANDKGSNTNETTMAFVEKIVNPIIQYRLSVVDAGIAAAKKKSSSSSGGGGGGDGSAPMDEELVKDPDEVSPVNILQTIVCDRTRVLEVGVVGVEN